MLVALTNLFERAWLLLMSLLGRTSLTLTCSPEQIVLVQMGLLVRT